MAIVNGDEAEVEVVEVVEVLEEEDGDGEAVEEVKDAVLHLYQQRQKHQLRRPLHYHLENIQRQALPLGENAHVTAITRTSCIRSLCNVGV